MLGRRPAREEQALARYGLELGMAFQLIDDLLDLVADERVLGKPVGDDLRQGKLTLPLIRLLRRGRLSDREMITRVVKDGSFRTIARAEIQEALLEAGLLDETRAFARARAQRALEALDGFPASAYRDALERVPEFVIARDR
jgi:octaprenyl-diphosphate synthase